jgi:hypothetical protein
MQALPPSGMRLKVVDGRWQCAASTPLRTDAVRVRRELVAAYRSGLDQT